MTPVESANVLTSVCPSFLYTALPSVPGALEQRHVEGNDVTARSMLRSNVVQLTQVRTFAMRLKESLCLLLHILFFFLLAAV